MWQNASDQYVLQMLLNERAVFATSYSNARRYYAPYIDRCRFQQLCALKVGERGRNSITGPLNTNIYGTLGFNLTVSCSSFYMCTQL